MAYVRNAYLRVSFPSLGMMTAPDKTELATASAPVKARKTPPAPAGPPRWARSGAQIELVKVEASGLRR